MDNKDINENEIALRTDDIDFDEEYKKDIQKKKNHKVNVTVLKNEKMMYDSFDFYILTGMLSLQQIKNFQDIFNEDLKHFTCIDRPIIRNQFNYTLRIANEPIRQPEVFRCYIQYLKTGFLIPIVLSRNTDFLKIPEYNLSNAAHNELCCFLSANIDLLLSIMNKETSSDMLSMSDNLFSCSLLFDYKYLNEVFKLKAEETFLSRCIWVDEKRKVNHSPRIKFQHNLKFKNSDDWASVSVDTGSPVFNIENKDKSLSPKYINQIQKFLEVNRDIITKLMNGDINKNDFLSKMIKIDKTGKQIKEASPYSDETKFKTIFVHSDFKIVLDRKTGYQNVIKNDKPLLDWMFMVSYNQSNNCFECVDKYGNDLKVDLNGKKL